MVDTIEKIGNVSLNLKHYCGKDLYSDGAVEDDLLRVVMEYSETELNAVIAKEKEWTLLYHLSELRQNIAGTLNIGKQDSVLEIGAGCGAITGALARKAKQVTCIELSKKRSTINAYRNQNYDNIEILVGNFQDIEQEIGQFDYITLIGVFEYGASYIQGEQPYVDFLKIIKNHLAPGGRIVMAIENKLGLKYFAGCREDHFGTYFEGIENYTKTSGIRTFTKRELQNICAEAGLQTQKFYYPYPDYKFPMKVFSDEYLPKPGELNNNLQNFDRKRLLLFNEGNVYNTLLEEGLYSVYANSFLVEIGDAKTNPTVYAKYSNDRAAEFAIITDIINVNSEHLVRKYAATPLAEAHISRLSDWGTALTAKYRDSKLQIVAGEKRDHYIEYAYIDGITLEERCDAYLKAGKTEEAKAVLHEYIGLIRERNGTEEFILTEEFSEAFERVFGTVVFKNTMHGGTAVYENSDSNFYMPVNNIDMVLNNVIEQNESWYLIDYEWTFPFPVPVEFIIYRILHYYLEGHAGREALQYEDFLEVAPEDLKVFAQMEQKFQAYVKGTRVPLRDLYETMGKAATDVVAVVHAAECESKLYRDYGAGYKEDTATNYAVSPDRHNLFTYAWKVEPGVKKYRFDPAEHGAVVKFVRVTGNRGQKVAFTTNGIQLEEQTYVYQDDPWIEIEVAGTVLTELKVQYYVQSDKVSLFETIQKYEQQKQEADAAIAALTDERNLYQEHLLAAHAQIAALESEKAALLNSKSWRLMKPVRKLKHGTKELLKSNPVTYKACRKVKHMIKGEPMPEPVRPEIEDVQEIVDILCPREEWNHQRATQFDEAIKFSILVPLYNTPERFLREMIESVQYQSYENWELCLADGSDEAHAQVGEICKEYFEKDSRIVYKKLTENLGISGNTNACIDMATGNYIALFDHDDFLHPSVLYENMVAICKYHADYLYTDEATFEGTNIFNIITKHCKPDFAIDNLRANNYICHFSVFKASLLEAAGRFRPKYDGSQDHDLILRLTDQAKKVFHIRKILYYWRSHPASVASDINAKTYAIDAAKRAVEAHMERAGLQAKVESSKAFPTIFKFKYELTDRPKISILIPNKDHKKDLQVCVDSVLKKSTYTNYEIIIIENNSIKEETFQYYEELKQHPQVKVVQYEGGFNYSKINNFGAEYATGEYLLLLNNDTEVITPDWMEQLLMYGQRQDVAVVGAKLYYADDTIQHAGIVIGLGADRAAGHTHYGVHKDNVGYMGRLYYAQNVSAVTGACMLVKTSIFKELGGLDEAFTVAYNDVDFCLKARANGYLNVFTPYCELYHYESKSRGFEDTKEKQERFQGEVKMFRKKWAKVLEDGDPYYNPNFSLDRSDYFIP